MNRRLPLSIGLIASGAALLLVTTQRISVGALILPLVLIIVGLVMLMRAFSPEGHEGNVFSGTFLALTGGFLLLWESALPAVELSMIWPIFMTIGGAALTSYGLKKGRDARLNLTIPGAVIILLSLVFLAFSLDLIQASLAAVAVRWWPAILMGVGILILVGAHNEDQDSDSDSES
ncbi:MAG: DUF5668 domain-containing protein [Alkalispirochaeta sp.]